MTSATHCSSSENNHESSPSNKPPVPQADPADGSVKNDSAVQGSVPNRLTTTSDFEIRDGLSNTFALGEAIPGFSPWSAWYWWNGTSATCAVPLNYFMRHPHEKNLAAIQDCYSFESRHPGGGVFGYADGHASFVTDTIDLEVYHGLATIDGGEVQTSHGEAVKPPD